MKRLVVSEGYFRCKPPFLQYATDFVVQRNTTKEKIMLILCAGHLSLCAIKPIQ